MRQDQSIGSSGIWINWSIADDVGGVAGFREKQFWNLNIWRDFCLKCLELSSCWFSAWNVDTCGGWSRVGHMCSYDVQQLPICWNLSSPIYFKASTMLKFKLANLYWPWVIYGKLLIDEYVYVANLLYKLRHFLEEHWMFFSLFFKALNMYISAMSPPPPWYFVAL